MKKWQNKLYLNDIRKAIDDYDMIRDGDRVIVGISGGKDSSLLLHSLNLLSKYSHRKFEVIAVHLDCGFDMDIRPLKEFCIENNIKIHIEETNIVDCLDLKGDKSPCYLCGRLRRGALGRVAKKINCNKIALGHHMDDAVETFLMNLLYTGKVGSFHPNKLEPNKNIFLIRPLIYIDERRIKKVIELENIPVIKSNCPFDGCTSRSEMKDLISNLEKQYPDIRQKIITALGNIDRDNVW